MAAPKFIAFVDLPCYICPEIQIIDSTLRHHFQSLYKVRPTLPERMPVYQALKAIWQMERLLAISDTVLAALRLELRAVAIKFLTQWHINTGLAPQRYDTAELQSPARTYHLTLFSLYLGSDGLDAMPGHLVNYETTPSKLILHWEHQKAPQRTFIEWESMFAHDEWLRRLYSRL
jgi:hypothetical protein